MTPISVLIVDDHTVAREGLRAMLDTDGEVLVVGEAENGIAAMERVKELQPQIVLMDIRMPVMDGLEATRRIKADHPTTTVVMMTSYDDDALVIDAVRAGAAGYLLKDASRDLLSHTIRAACGGGILIKATLLRKAINSLALTSQPFDGAPSRQEVSPTVLTDREQAVLHLLIDGRTNKEIGDALNLAEVTVKKHVQTIIAKLHASDRTHAAIVAMRMGLIS